jgi:hypothetical protein
VAALNAATAARSASHPRPDTTIGAKKAAASASHAGHAGGVRVVGHGAYAAEVVLAPAPAAATGFRGLLQKGLAVAKTKAKLALAPGSSDSGDGDSGSSVPTNAVPLAQLPRNEARAKLEARAAERKYLRHLKEQADAGQFKKTGQEPRRFGQQLQPQQPQPSVTQTPQASQQAQKLIGEFEGEAGEESEEGHDGGVETKAASFDSDSRSGSGGRSRDSFEAGRSRRLVPSTQPQPTVKLSAAEQFMNKVNQK